MRGNSLKVRSNYWRRFYVLVALSYPSQIVNQVELTLIKLMLIHLKGEPLLCMVSDN